MKASVVAVSLLSAIVSAAPTPQTATGSTTGNSTSNDIQNGQCGDVNLVMARGSTEPGNMVGSPFTESHCWPQGQKI